MLKRQSVLFVLMAFLFVLVSPSKPSAEIVDLTGGIKNEYDYEEYVFILGQPMRFTATSKDEGRFAAQGMPPTSLESIFGTKHRGSSTSLLNGFKTVQNYMKKDASIGNIPKAMIIISDGNFSNVKDIVTFAKENDVKIYTVAIGKTKDTKQTALKEMASQTGGQFYQLVDINNITNVYNSIMKALCINLVDSCPENFDSFHQADVTIGRTYLFIKAQADCGNVEKIKVKFYSIYGELEYDLKYIGKNMFELEHDIRKIHNFNVYEEVEFFAYDKSGTLLANKKVKIQ